MKIIKSLKRSGKVFVKKQQEIGIKNAKKRKERKEYNSQLNKELITIRRDAYRKEALKQARLKAQVNARNKFNPPKQKSGAMGNINDIINRLPQ